MLNIDTYDLGFLRERFADEHPKFIPDFDKIGGELRKFFKMAQSDDAVGPIAVMSHKVDSLWHTFILHTPQYVPFCNEAFGGYLHHQPRSEAIPVPAEAISNFYKQYPKHYGDVPPMWLEDIPPKCCNHVVRGEVPLEVQQLKWSGWPGWV